MKNIEDLVKKISAHKNKWVKIKIEGYYFISYFKVLNCILEKSALKCEDISIDNIRLNYSKGLEEHINESGKKKIVDYINLYTKKNTFIMNTSRKISVSFLKECPRNVINKCTKKLEKDLDDLRSIRNKEFI